jgi:hypothetical protein
VALYSGRAPRVGACSSASVGRHEPAVPRSFRPLGTAMQGIQPHSSPAARRFRGQAVYESGHGCSTWTAAEPAILSSARELRERSRLTNQRATRHRSPLSDGPFLPSGAHNTDRRTTHGNSRTRRIHQ